MQPVSTCLFSSRALGGAGKKEPGCKDSLNRIFFCSFFLGSDNAFHLLVKYAARIYPKIIAALSAVLSICEYLS